MKGILGLIRSSLPYVGGLVNTLGKVGSVFGVSQEKIEGFVEGGIENLLKFNEYVEGKINPQTGLGEKRRKQQRIERPIQSFTMAFEEPKKGKFVPRGLSKTMLEDIPLHEQDEYQGRYFESPRFSKEEIEQLYPRLRPQKRREKFSRESKKYLGDLRGESKPSREIARKRMELLGQKYLSSGVYNMYTPSYLKESNFPEMTSQSSPFGGPYLHLPNVEHEKYEKRLRLMGKGKERESTSSSPSLEKFFEISGITSFLPIESYGRSTSSSEILSGRSSASDILSSASSGVEFFEPSSSGSFSPIGQTWGSGVFSDLQGQGTGLGGVHIESLPSSTFSRARDIYAKSPFALPSPSPKSKLKEARKKREAAEKTKGSSAKITKGQPGSLIKKLREKGIEK